MATGFDDREKAYESKYAHDQETNFKIMARRNKLLGIWAAGKMGLEGGAAEAYAKDVVKSDFQEVGEEDVFRKVYGDLQEKNVQISEHQVRREMADLLETAREQVTSE